jgi:hypothetical protein
MNQKLTEGQENGRLVLVLSHLIPSLSMKINMSYLIEKGLAEESPNSRCFMLTKLGKTLGKDFAEELYRGKSIDC